MNLAPTSDESPSIFETIRHIADNGVEFWMARELMPVVEYDEWRNFENAIKRAIVSCNTSGIPANHHFVGFNKMIEVGKGAMRSVSDYYLSRHACYLIFQNSDASKPVIAKAQSYFVKQVFLQEAKSDSDVDRRIAIRERLTVATKQLNAAAKDAGVMNYALFHDAGYRGLYGGMRLNDIRNSKGLREKDALFDHIGPAELAANEFRATQAEEKLRREKIKDEDKARGVHKSVGESVRKAILAEGNTPPENLPTEPDIKKIITQRKRIAKRIES